MSRGLLTVQTVAVPSHEIDPPALRSMYTPAPGLPAYAYACVKLLCVARDEPSGIFYVWREGAPQHSVILHNDLVDAEMAKLNIPYRLFVAARLGDMVLTYHYKV